MTELSDEFLLAYIDGQLEKRQSGEVSQLANTNVEISRRVARLRRSQAQLAASFGAFAREQIAVPRGALQFDESDGKQFRKEKPILHTATPQQQAAKEPDAFRKMLFVMAVFAGGVMGGYGATIVSGQRAPLQPKDTERAPAAQLSPTSWPADIARFHSFFPRETLAPHPDAIANPELIRFQLSKITAKALTPPDFIRQGYTLYRGQAFTYRQDRMMQLVYASNTSKTEPPLTLYALTAPDLQDSSVAVQVLGSNRAASWVTDHVRFLLTGEKDEEDLKLLAVMAQSQMAKRS